MVGLVMTNATAHNISDDQRSHGAEHLAFGFLDGEPDAEKHVLLIFGDIDVRHITERHPDDRIARLDTALACYADFISLIASRPDVRRVIVASASGFHGCLPPYETGYWNGRVRSMCELRLWGHVDLYGPGERFKDPCSGNHLPPEAQTDLLAAIMAALGPDHTA